MTGYVGRGRSQASTFCAHLCTTSLLFCISASEHGGCQPVTNQPLVSVAAQIKSATRKVEQSKHTTAARKCRLKRSQSVLACLLGQLHGTLRWMHRLQPRMQLAALHSCGGGSSVTAGREHVSGPSSGVRKLKRFFLVSIPFNSTKKIMLLDCHRSKNLIMSRKICFKINEKNL